MRTPGRVIAVLLVGSIAGAAIRFIWAQSVERPQTRAESQAVAAAPAIASDEANANRADRRASLAASSGAVAATSDTPDSIAAALIDGGFESLERLIRWLPTASSADIDQLVRALDDHPGAFSLLVGDAIFLRWTEIDPAAAIAAAKRSYREAMAFWAWAKNDPDAALEAALKESDRRLGVAVLRSIAQTNPDRARTLLDQYPQFEDLSSIEGLAGGMEKIDPRAAADLAARSRGSDDVILSWAQRDPDAALDWARQLPDLEHRRQLLTQMFDRWTWSHPDKIGPAIEGLPAGRTKAQLFAAHAARLAERDSASAEAWVAKATSPAVQEASIMATAATYARTDPTRAIETLKQLDWSAEGARNLVEWRVDGKQLGSFGEEDRAGDALRQLATTHPDQALEFVSQLPESPRTRRAYSTAFGSYLETDPEAASRWVAQQPSGWLRDNGVVIMINNLTRGTEPDFEAAAAWAATLEASQAESQLQGIFQRWKTQDPDAAARGLESRQIPDSLRQKLK